MDIRAIRRVRETMKMSFTEALEALDDSDKIKAEKYIEKLLSDPKYTRRNRIKLTTNERTANNGTEKL